MNFFLGLTFTLAVALALASSETEKEKTTEAVVKAVAEAVTEPAGKSQEDKDAAAVADATIDVLKSESKGTAALPVAVLAEAKDEAKETFKALDKAEAGTKAAADAAAKVAVAEVDGASGLKVSEEVKTNAEEAAVATGEALVDHPKDEEKAVGDAVSTLKKEEKDGKADVAPKESIIAKTEDVVAEIPEVAENAVSHPLQDAGIVLVFVVVVVAMGMYSEYNKGNIFVSPYVRQLREMRKGNFEDQSAKKDCEFGQYECYSECKY